VVPAGRSAAADLPLALALLPFSLLFQVLAVLFPVLALVFHAFPATLEVLCLVLMTHGFLMRRPVFGRFSVSLAALTLMLLAFTAALQVFPPMLLCLPDPLLVLRSGDDCRVPSSGVLWGMLGGALGHQERGSQSGSRNQQR
jgi:hypothetical protein